MILLGRKYSICICRKGNWGRDGVCVCVCGLKSIWISSLCANTRSVAPFIVSLTDAQLSQSALSPSHSRVMCPSKKRARGTNETARDVILRRFKIVLMRQHILRGLLLCCSFALPVRFGCALSRRCVSSASLS